MNKIDELIENYETQLKDLMNARNNKGVCYKENFLLLNNKFRNRSIIYEKTKQFLSDLSTLKQDNRIDKALEYIECYYNKSCKGLTNGMDEYVFLKELKQILKGEEK